jgi:quinol monooxygenase YgiN
MTLTTTCRANWMNRTLRQREEAVHIIVHTIPVKPNTLDRAREFFEQQVPPLAERFSSWRGARLCATDDNLLVTFGMWEDEDQMREFLSQPAFQAAMTSFSELFAGPPSQYITQELTAVGPARAKA